MRIMPLVDYSSDSDNDTKLPVHDIDFAPIVNDTTIASIEPDAHLEPVYTDSKRPIRSTDKRSRKKRKKGTVDNDFLGPWASFDEESSSDEEPQQELPNDPESDDATEANGLEKPTTEYFATYKYSGSFLDVPSITGVDLLKPPGIHECFVPKNIVHTFPGHDAGTSKIELFPNSGHLLLSCGNDSVIRLWDMYHKKELIREYYGHSKSVKDIAFNSTGNMFLSCSFDKKVVVWDTESGRILHTLTLSSVPMTLIFKPDSDNEFLVGLMNSNIEHYAINETIDLIQTYDHHVSSINALCVVERGSKFLSASDDKSVRIWKWGINIPVKTITHPTQYAISSAIPIPPSESLIALQNMNNAIQVIEGEDKFRFKRKTFKNIHVTGYKIEIGVSPDGKILMAGDSKGQILFWDWSSGKLVRTLKVSKELISTVKFHPQEKSKVVAAGVDGKIFYCD